MVRRCSRGVASPALNAGTLASRIHDDLERPSPGRHDDARPRRRIVTPGDRVPVVVRIDADGSDGTPSVIEPCDGASPLATGKATIHVSASRQKDGRLATIRPSRRPPASLKLLDRPDQGTGSAVQTHCGVTDPFRPGHTKRGPAGVGSKVLFDYRPKGRSR